MPNTFSQISIQGVFAVQHRANFILDIWRDDLQKYIAGVINGNGGKSLAVGGWRDHMHIFFGMEPTLCISDFIGQIKASSTNWINQNKLTKQKFNWQSGFGAFSYSKSQRDDVIKYIMRQEDHHRIQTFREEYLQLLRDFDVGYNEKYLFEFYD
jgi:putative transposase